MVDDKAARKHQRIQWVQRHLVNPPAKAAVWCGLVPGFVLVETTGRRSGERRVNVLGMRLEGNTGWVIAEYGRHAGYVNNLEANADVRVRVHRQWRERESSHPRRRRSSGPARVVAPARAPGGDPAIRHRLADHSVRAPACLTCGSVLRRSRVQSECCSPRAAVRPTSAARCSRGNPSDDYVAAIEAYAGVIAADPRAYDGYYAWQVYVTTTAGTRRLPEGWTRQERSQACRGRPRP